MVSFTSFLFPFVDVRYSSRHHLTFLMALWLQSGVFRNHIIVVVHDDLQYG